MLETIPLEHGLIVASILFCLGIIGLLIRRDLLFILMSLEIIMNSAALAFIVAGSAHTNVLVDKVINGKHLLVHAADGQVMYIMIIALAAAEAAIGLALLLQLYRRFHTLDIDAASEMRG